ncbi:MAG: hypothetical protein FWC80_00925 [Firmicutes bacterium]|nr:hypothetical protein [Bacillota bacterium]
MLRAIKKHNRLVVCILLTVLSVVLAVTVFSGAFASIANSGRELGRSFVAYVRFIFLFEPPTYSPITPPSGDINILPDTGGEFVNNGATFFRTLFSSQNFFAYVFSLEFVLIILVRFLPFIIIIIWGIRRYVRRAFTKHNNKYNKDTKSLKGFKRLSNRLYVPPKTYLLYLLEYIRYSVFVRFWLLIWLFNFNIFAIFLSAISVILHFIVSLDFVSLYYFFYNAVVLITPAFRYIPIWLWLIPIIILIDRYRKRIALARLRHMENMNKGFILELPICTMLVGSMGTGKTTLVSDISLSTETIFRYKAYEMMLDIDLMFPHFPYIVLENQLKEELETGRVFNLASCAEWVRQKERSFKWSLGYTPTQAQRIYKKALKRGVSKEIASQVLVSYNICDYDYVKYGLDYDDKKTVTPLFKALEDYLKLYLIYWVSSSLIISNYSIRTDFVKIDQGNMPFWDLDFFGRDSRQIRRLSRHSHILDFDMFRLGKKLIENNKQANVFEFGVVAITEVGKERGNQFKDAEIKDTIKQLRETIKNLEKAKLDPSKPQAELERLTTRATQLTDKFNSALKLIRHKCTVANFPFARLIMDEQRPDSLGADARQICDIVYIKEKTETRLTMPFFFIGELIYSLVFPRFKGVYQNYRISRGDNTLLMYWLKKLGAVVHQSHTRTYNRFGYHIRYLAIEDGMTQAVRKECPYYLSHKKIYSNRFSTDAYKDIFAEQLKTVDIGIDDIPEYASPKATQAELEQQNSYFVNELLPK